MHPSSRRTLLIFIGLTVAFYVATFFTAVFGFVIGMSNFDTGEPPPVMANVLITIHMVLRFPLGTLLESGLKDMHKYGVPLPFPLIIEHLVILANSALWAGLLTFLGRLVLSRNRKSDL